ncbi:MAG: YhjD/YihY/BrkB family envelope integrity protein [Caldilineaceae bacterium]
MGLAIGALALVHGEITGRYGGLVEPSSIMSDEKIISASWSLFKATLQQWAEDNAAHHAAALAFYTLFSLAPLLVIAVAIASIFVGQQAIQEQIVGWVQQYVKAKRRISSAIFWTM